MGDPVVGTNPTPLIRSNRDENYLLPWASARAHDFPCIHQRRRFDYCRWLGGLKAVLGQVLPVFRYPIHTASGNLVASHLIHFRWVPQGTIRIISRYTGEGCFRMVFHHNIVDHRGHGKASTGPRLIPVPSMLNPRVHDSRTIFPAQVFRIIGRSGIVCMLNGYANALNFVLCQVWEVRNLINREEEQQTRYCRMFSWTKYVS